MDLSEDETETNKLKASENNAPEPQWSDANKQNKNNETVVDQNKENTENKDQQARPHELKEKDPILEAFRNVQSQEELEILLADYNTKKLKSSKVSETEIETQNGTVNVKEYSLLKTPVWREWNLGCTECDVKKVLLLKWWNTSWIQVQVLTVPENVWYL